MRYKFMTYEGPPIPITLTLGFIVLKLMGVVDWSWWIVLSPFWVFYLLIIVLWYYLSYGGYRGITRRYRKKN